MNKCSLRFLSIGRTGRVPAGVLLLLVTFGWATPADAQLAQGANTVAIVSGFVRGSDTAWDPVNHVYLAVAAHGTLYAGFVDASGNVLGLNLKLHTYVADPTPFAQFPRVIYCADLNNGLGAFFVTWHQNDSGNTNFVHTQIVAYPGTLIGPEHVVSGGGDPSGTFWEMGAAIGYSPTSRHFYVAWSTNGGGSSKLQGTLVDLNGSQMPGTLATLSSGYARDPGVAWNSTPGVDEFGISWDGENTSGVTANFARVNAATGTELRRNPFYVTAAAAHDGTYITDLAFNTATGRFLMAWQELSGGGTIRSLRAAEIAANGDVVATGLVSTVIAFYDGLGLSYNPTTGTFLAVSHDYSSEVGGAELNSHGARFGSEQILTNAGCNAALGNCGNYYPRATANSSAKQWNITFSHQFKLLADQVVVSTQSNGGPAGSLGPAASPTTPPPTTPPPTTPPTGCTTPDPFVALGGGTCANGGWTPSSAPAPPPPPTPPPTPLPSGCTSVQPGANWICVNGGWVPPVTPACPSVQPGATWTCFNGGWLPPGATPPTTPPPVTPPASGCPTVQPGANWTCVNGAWVLPAASTCTSVKPGADWTCSNGGWLPPTATPPTTPPPTGTTGTGTTGTGTSGGCSTPDPFKNIPGMTGVCINGGWVPSNSPLAGG